MGKSAVRNNNIDTVKFLLIFSIYIFHFFEAGGNLYPFTDTFHVPAFFMVSGFWALNHKERSIWEFIKNAFKRYLFPWFIWVCIYTIYNSVNQSYEVRDTAKIFLKYAKAIRGSGITGMWFVPAFFFVALFYLIISKLTNKLKFKGQFGQPIVNLLISFAIYFAFRYINVEETWIFTFDQVPKHLCYYSLGTVGYRLYSYFNSSAEENVGLKQIFYGLLAAVSIAYTAGVYFKKMDLLWKWTALFPDDMLSFLPNCTAVIMSLIALCFIAKFITCKTTERIGRSTLVLCCSEIFVRNIIINIFSLIGLTAKPKNPIECVIFAFVALVISTYTVVPFTERINDRFWNGSAKLKA